MDERTLTALKGSIAKWEGIVAGTGKDDGPLNCPLCQLFHPDYRTDNLQYCKGCPVTIAGFSGCSNDAYESFCHAEEEFAFGEAKAGTPAERMHAAAIGELAFLKSLLPEVQS